MMYGNDKKPAPMKPAKGGKLPMGGSGKKGKKGGGGKGKRGC